MLNNIKFGPLNPSKKPHCPQKTLIMPSQNMWTKMAKYMHIYTQVSAHADTCQIIP